MNIEKIHNTTVNLPDREVKPGEVIANVQICPIGDFPNGDHQQHCTAEALQNVVKDWTERGSKEILVDFEHNSESHEPNSDTSAAAWVSNVRVDPERGLVGDFKLTDVGAEAISNRRLRFLSVSWFVNKETHEPIRITSIALTNKPNIPVDPVLNKDPEPDNQNVEDKEKSKMDKIKEALGLAPEATEEQVLEAITAMVKANKDAQQAALEKEAEDFAEKNSKKCNKDVLKAQYLANKEVAMALVAGIPDAPVTQVVNKDAAKKPTAASFEQNRAGAESDEQILNKYESLSGKAKDEYLEQNCVAIDRARRARDSK